MYNLNFGCSSANSFYGQGSIANFNFVLKSLSTYFVLFDGNNFNSIFADVSADFNSGKFYVTTSGSLNIIDLSSNNLYDIYTTNIIGRSNEFLENTGIVDINVN